MLFPGQLRLGEDFSVVELDDDADAAATGIPQVFWLLKEDADALLQETGDFILLESAP